MTYLSSIQATANLTGRDYFSFPTRTEDEDRPFAADRRERHDFPRQRQLQQFERERPLANLVTRANGFSLEDAIERQKTVNIPGGTRLDITGEVTIETSEGDSLELDEDSQARIFQRDRRHAIIQDRETEEEIRLRRGDNFTVNGEGEARLEGRFDSLELPDTETFELRSDANGGLEVRRPATERQLSIENGQPIEIEVEEDQYLSFLDGGEAIRFESGDEGWLEAAGDDMVALLNIDTGRRMEFPAERSISIVGEGEATIGGQIEVNDNRRLRFEDLDGELFVFEPSSAEQTEVAPLMREPGHYDRITFHQPPNGRLNQLEHMLEAFLAPQEEDPFDGRDGAFQPPGGQIDIFA